VKQAERYLVRRNLDAYAEIAFSHFLASRGFIPYFPFKDVGIDMLGMKKGAVELYQLKSRNEMRAPKHHYWFPARKNVTPLSKLKGKVFFILCALQPNQKDFHYFKVQVSVVDRYFRLKHYQKSKHFEIKRLKDGSYKIVPDYISIDVNAFRLR
jgi:hypothetical protein